MSFSLWSLENVWCTLTTISKHKKAITAFNLQYISIHFYQWSSLLTIVPGTLFFSSAQLLFCVPYAKKELEKGLLCSKPQQIGIILLHILEQFHHLECFNVLASYFEINCSLLSIKLSLFILSLCFVCIWCLHISVFDDPWTLEYLLLATLATL